MSGDIELTNLIYDHYRNLSLNRKYYAVKLNSARGANFVMDVAIAVGATGSGIAGLAVWQTNSGKSVWACITAFAAVISVLKPILKIGDKIEKYSKQYGEYNALFMNMKYLVEDIQVRKSLSSTAKKEFYDSRRQVALLSSQDDPSPSKRTIHKLQTEVNIEIFVGDLWIPVHDSRTG